MKNRDGFVSNSSTSSFFIYGTIIELKDIHKFLTEEAIRVLKEYHLKQLKESGKQEEKIDDSRYIHGVYRSEVCEVLGLAHTYCGEEGYIAIGQSPEYMDDNETKAQFKERVEKSIKEFFNVTDFGFEEGEYCC